MLTEQGLAQYYERLKLPGPTRTLINSIRSSEPARRVRNGRKNGTVHFPSRKMGWTVQAESVTVEFPCILQLEHDDNRLEYYDQPNKIKLNYRSRTKEGGLGRMVGVLHTPDFFVLEGEAAGWIECKAETELVKLAEASPERYTRTPAGEWRCPPGERYAEPLGLFYRVWTDAAVSWHFHNNLLYLDDYFRGASWAVETEAAQEVLTLVRREPGLRLTELQERVSLASGDDINKMILTDEIFVDLLTEPLSEPERVQVFSDQWTARVHWLIADQTVDLQPGGWQNVKGVIGEVVTWNETAYQILNHSDTEVTLRCQQDRTESVLLRLNRVEFGTLVERGEIRGSTDWIEQGMSAEAREKLNRASPKQLQAGYERYRAITDPVYQATVPERTRRRYQAQYQQAQVVHRCGFVGLLDNYERCGNHQPKLPERTVELMNQYIAEEYEAEKQPSMASVHLKYQQACKDAGVVAASYPTFCQAVHHRNQKEQTRRRKGFKAAQAVERFYWSYGYTTPRHGLFPLHMAHLDHTLIDLELLHSYTQLNLGRAYLSTMFDAYSKRVLATYLSYEPPSYRTLMMLGRECVRRFGRLPGLLVHDGGPEFRSVYFDKLLALYEVIKRARRKSTPRDGNVLERLFGTENVQLFYNMLGNTQLTKENVRLVTKTTDPRQLANWTLPRLYDRVREWAYEVYDNTYHPVLGQTPRQAFALGMSQSGARSHRYIPYDEQFLFNTLPTTAKGEAKVDACRGVKINYIYYWHDVFYQAGVAGNWVPVRYDPENMGISYAYIKAQDRWVRCLSEHYSRLQGRSEKMVKLATAELRQQNRLLGQNKAITAWRIVEFLARIDREEKYFVELYRDIDNQIIRGMAEGRYDLDHRGLPPSLAARLLLPNAEKAAELSQTVMQPVPDLPVETDTPDLEEIEPYEIFTMSKEWE